MDGRYETTSAATQQNVDVGAKQSEEEHHVGQLLTRLGRETFHLIQQETALARTEIGENLADAKKGAIAIGTSLAVLVPGLTVLLLGAAYGIAEVLPLWASLLIVGGAVVLLGIGLAFAGKKQLEWEKLAPTKTTESLRADSRFVREQVTT